MIGVTAKSTPPSTSRRDFRFSIGETQHVEEVVFQGQNLGDVVSAGQVVHRHGQHTGAEAGADAAFADAFLDDFEEGAQEAVFGGELEIAEEVAVVRHHDFGGATVQNVEVLSQPLHKVGHCVGDTYGSKYFYIMMQPIGKYNALIICYIINGSHSLKSNFFLNTSVPSVTTTR